MTPSQKSWLEDHPDYRPIGHGTTYRKRGTLKPDGLFIPDTPAYPLKEGNGSFGVGVPVLPGDPQNDPRGYITNPTAPDPTGQLHKKKA